MTEVAGKGSGLLPRWRIWRGLTGSHNYAPVGCVEAADEIEAEKVASTLFGADILVTEAYRGAELKG
jgi:hypothetical protein